MPVIRKEQTKKKRRHEKKLSFLYQEQTQAVITSCSMTEKKEKCRIYLF